MTFLPFKAQHPLLPVLNQHVPANPSGQGQLGFRHLAKSCRLHWLWKLVHLPVWCPFMPFALKVLYRFPPASRPIDMLGLVITDNSLVSDAG